MPRTTVYIRNDDWDKWKLIDNKAELISQALNRSIIQPVQKRNGTTKTIQEAANLALDEQLVKRTLTKPRELKSPSLCEHFQPKGECLTKGCKYAK